MGDIQRGFDGRLRWPLLLLAPIAVLLVSCIAVERSDTGSGALGKQKGISYAAWQPNQYSQPDADLSLANLASTGANWISLIVTGYQDTVSSTKVYTTTATPTDASLAHAIRQAHRLGLRVMLKPHVDLLRDATRWRGQIGEAFAREEEWASWFGSYRSFIEHYAELARTYDVDQFAVGTELAATVRREEDWRRVIKGVRALYGGPITYAANYGDEANSISWWDALDYIGVNAYYPLTQKDDPTVAELREAWAPPVAELAGLSSRWRKAIIVTEVGYESKDGANRSPAGTSGPVDHQEQADAYQAAFDSLFRQSWLAGMYWWAWSADPFEGGECDGGFTPQNKPAEDFLRAWYGGRPSPTPAPTPQPNYGRTMEIYGDGLAPYWQDWSWDAERHPSSSDVAYSGKHSLSVVLKPWGALSFWRPPFDSSPFYWLEFYVRGWPGTEQRLWVFFYAEGNVELRKRPVDNCLYIQGGVIEPGVWKRVRVPLKDLNAVGRSLTRIVIQDRGSGAPTAFWLDEVRLVGASR